ncbi:hypothetical protein FRC00_005835 [Tulasnella sp. 408]|nr:hypothetical protein FRC00_005835 [Tulasnella sp. 408]
METSQAELGQGDKSTQAISSVDSTAVNTTQSPPASEAEPPSNTGNLPTVRVDDTAAQGVATPEEGGTSEGNQVTFSTFSSSERTTANINFCSTTSIDSGETLAPNESEDSLVQPGVHVRERELPSELAGALTKIRELVGPVKKKSANRTDGGAYADIYEGELEQPDGSNIVVAIKCIRGIQGNIEAVNKVRVIKAQVGF